MSWKDPISMVIGFANDLIRMAEQYWIHVGIGIVCLIFIIMYLMIKNG